MAVSIDNADAYIANYVVDNVDWTESDTPRKNRILNVATRELNARFTGLIIPDEAVYEFAAVLAVAFNDTNRYQLQGVAGMSITGVGAFSFKGRNVVDSTGRPRLFDLIPYETFRLINDANPGANIKRRMIKDVTL